MSVGSRVGWLLLVLLLLLRGRLVWPAGGRGGRLAAGGGLAAAHELLLRLEVCILAGRKRVAGPHQRVLDRSDELGGEDGLRRDGAGHRFLPSLEHLVHLAARAVVDLGICAHEYRVELRAEIQGVRRGDVFDDGVEYVECGESSVWWCLVQVSFCTL